MAKVKKSTSKKPTTKKATKKTPKKKLNITFKKPNFKDMDKKAILKNVALVLILVGSFTLIDLAVQYLNNDYSVAVVNGSRVSEKEWHKLLEGAYGTAAAQQLIEEEIIKQEAKIADISIEEADIDAEVKKIVDSIGGQDLFESALEANNITLTELKYQIEVDLLTQEILKPELEYTAEDVKDFFDQYSDVLFPTETSLLEDGEKLIYDEYMTQTEETYIQQQVETNKITWLAAKKAEYKIQDNSIAKPSYGFLTTTRNIFKNIASEEVVE